VKVLAELLVHLLRVGKLWIKTLPSSLPHLLGAEQVDEHVIAGEGEGLCTIDLIHSYNYK
jgi:hypothetical protein